MEALSQAARRAATPPCDRFDWCDGDCRVQDDVLGSRSWHAAPALDFFGGAVTLVVSYDELRVPHGYAYLDYAGNGDNDPADLRHDAEEARRLAAELLAAADQVEKLNAAGPGLEMIEEACA